MHKGVDPRQFPNLECLGLCHFLKIFLESFFVAVKRTAWRNAWQHRVATGWKMKVWERPTFWYRSRLCATTGGRDMAAAVSKFGMSGTHFFAVKRSRSRRSLGSPGGQARTKDRSLSRPAWPEPGSRTRRRPASKFGMSGSLPFS